MAAANPALPSYFTLNNGVQMPAIGLGTYRIRNSDAVFKALDSALEAGYRMFDTASVYGNEVHIKNAFSVLLPKYGLEREDIFITTKLYHGGGELTEKACQQSLDNLGVDYVDLYLIHFPGSAKIPADDKRNREMREMTWSKLTELYDDGRMNALGVSNFTIRHLKDLMKCNHGVVPAVNQVEWHPYYHQNSLYKYCKANDIVLQAYCSLGGTSASNTALLNDPVVVRTAKKLEATPAQILLVWALQQDIAIIPKSITPERIKENFSLNFKIPDEDMKALQQLGENNVKYAWDPSIIA
ncbi:uncharacterized oxidoreductase YtbE isoform X2 [Manduca sexta]|uniref:NADP-dependent oxidoreductase domain-containing protein n=2 Tax=Manduca sexta TaxID=7130 RepID=A0A921Z7N6_MANSE|nr:uncharacterized oxidoreductase YtbE isoform X2 [Manduca sexta]XP_030026949.1 uncharacterized oxidoreductase YtbE isoform X2 [Manduca sexta]KAG6452474.1 hypothetical protein O3G_MSEX007655 [Manduca sexta]KAG6452475.1 hypothetical protein O3G_MSEX007655 [Manduca sexta]